MLDKCYAANVRSVFLASTEAVRVMPEGSAVINIASVLGAHLADDRAAYGAAKAAVLYLTRAFAAEWADRPIAVNAVAPGVVLTDEVRELVAQDSAQRTRLGAATATGSFARPEDVADMVVTLARQPRDLVTGQVWKIDAGWSLR